MNVQFHETMMGKRFYEGTMPKVNDNLSELTQAVTALTAQVEVLNRELAALRKEKEGEKHED